jgi:hypothetical protein
MINPRLVLAGALVVAGFTIMITAFQNGDLPVVMSGGLIELAAGFGIGYRND